MFLTRINAAKTYIEELLGLHGGLVHLVGQVILVLLAGGALVLGLREGGRG